MTYCTLVLGVVVRSAGMKYCKDFILLYALTFMIILPLICFELEHSMYHSVDRQNVIEYRKRVEKMNGTSKARLEWANNFLHREELKDELEVHEKALQQKDVPFVMITIITMSRKIGDNYDPQYVTQVTGKVFQLMHDFIQDKQTQDTQTQAWRRTREGLRLALALCNVDSKPGHHTAIRNLSKVIPTFTKYGDRADSMGVNLVEKEKRDFVFCLRKSLEPVSSHGFMADYVLLLEDDAYPLNELFPVLAYQIHSHLERPTLNGVFRRKSKSTAYVKLYHPKRLQGYYSLEPDRLPEVLAIGMVFGTILTLAYRHVRPRAYNFFRTKWIDFSFLAFVVYCTLVAFSIGKQNLQWLRRLSKYLYVYVPTPSCCTPAMLFPRHGAERIIEGLSQIHCKEHFAKDMALDLLLRTANLSAYMLTPSLFEHIGMYSTLNSGKLVDPIVVP